MLQSQIFLYVQSIAAYALDERKRGEAIGGYSRTPGGMHTSLKNPALTYCLDLTNWGEGRTLTEQVSSNGDSSVPQSQ